LGPVNGFRRAGRNDATNACSFPGMSHPSGAELPSPIPEKKRKYKRLLIGCQIATLRVD
jgi:hypothetical protein